MNIKCNAKINLTLKIVGKREDGYHLLDSVFLPINIFDKIKVSKTKEDSKIYINDKLCDFENNICIKVVNYIENKYQIKERYKFNIIKNIPIGGGLGGGSSDACEIFKFYNKKYKLNIPLNDSINILSKFGADIPFFLINKPCRINGIGDKITNLNLNNKYYILLLNPNINISTKEVYSAFDKLNIKSSINVDELINNLKVSNNNLNCYMGNDLEVAAFTICPKIKELKDRMIKMGLDNVLMTGSGSTIFSISQNKKKLLKAYKLFKKEKLSCYLTTTKY